MKRFRLLHLAVASMPMVVQAQSAQVAAVTDASAAVPPPKYQSAFADYVRAEEPALSPNKQWVQASREMAGTSSPEMSDPAPSAVPAGTKDAGPGKPEQGKQADPHAGHHMNKKGH